MLFGLLLRLALPNCVTISPQVSAPVVFSMQRIPSPVPSVLSLALRIYLRFSAPRRPSPLLSLCPLFPSPPSPLPLLSGLHSAVSQYLLATIPLCVPVCVCRTSRHSFCWLCQLSRREENISELGPFTVEEKTDEWYGNVCLFYLAYICPYNFNKHFEFPESYFSMEDQKVDRRGCLSRCKSTRKWTSYLWPDWNHTLPLVFEYVHIHGWISVRKFFRLVAVWAQHFIVHAWTMGAPLFQ